MAFVRPRFHRDSLFKEKNLMSASDKDTPDFLDKPIEGKLEEKLSAMEQRYVELEQLISDPEQQGSGKFQELLKEHGSLLSLVNLYREYGKSRETLTEAQEIIDSGDDAELKELAEAELPDLEQECCDKARAVRMAILDQQVEGGDDCIFEVRAGTGGEEAALFCADIFRLYSLYAEKRRWKIEVISESSTDLGGYKEITFAVRGSGAFSRLCFESGGHEGSARSRHRDPRTNPHLGDHGGGDARGRGIRDRSRRKGPAHRHLLCIRAGRAVRQQNLERGEDHPFALRSRRFDAG